MGPKSCLGATGPWEQRPDPATQLWVRSFPPRERMGASELCQAGSLPCPSRLIFGDNGSAGPWGAPCCLPPSLQPHGSSRVMLGGILLPPPPGAAGAAVLHVAPYHACSRAGGGGGEPGGRGRAPAAPGSYCSWLSPFQSMKSRGLLTHWPGLNSSSCKPGSEKEGGLSCAVPARRGAACMELQAQS